MKRKITSRIVLFLIGFMLIGLYQVNAQAPTINSFSPTSGTVGSIVTLTGTNLSNPTSFTIGGVTAIVISNTGTSLVAMVMPGATTGAISINTGTGNATSTGTFTVNASQAPNSQQGSKLLGTGAIGSANQGYTVSLSADGNTAIVGGPNDNNYVGAAWIYTRNGSNWSQQGNKLIGSGAVGAASQGTSVSISADGNTAIVGGYVDNNALGAAWVFTRSGSTWSQQGSKLVGAGAIGQSGQGKSVSISADGNTAIVGGYLDNNDSGAAWVFTRRGGVWSQLGNKLVGTGAVGAANQGFSVSISADGNTAIVGGYRDNNDIGAAWVYNLIGNTWSQQGNKLVGSGSIGRSFQGQSVSINADGNTAIVGGPSDNSSIGAAWIYTRIGSVWSQQGNKLVGTGAAGSAQQGYSLSLSADGNMAIVGGSADSSTGTGAIWIFTRNGSNWSQQGNKLVGTGALGTTRQGSSVSLSADGNTVMLGGYNDNSGKGAAWVFIFDPPAITSYTPTSGYVGSTVTLTCKNITNPTSITIGGVPAIMLSNTGTSIVAMVMPGATTGVISIITNIGIATSTGTFTLSSNQAPNIQQGNKLVGTGYVGQPSQGSSVAVSADGNTAIVGGLYDNGNISGGIGGAWIYTRTGSTWSQQGIKLVGSGSIGQSSQGQSVSISADGNTAIVGGYYDNSGKGAVWIYTRSGSTWSQQGIKLVGSGAVGSANQGQSVSISADGNTAIVGGPSDNGSIGAAWIFTRSGGIWSQLGNKLVGTSAVGNTNQGRAVSISADGNTAIVGGSGDNNNIGAAWVYTFNGTSWNQQGNKLVGSGFVGQSFQGQSVSLSANGNTALIGGNNDNNNIGAAWVFTRSGSAWSQQGNKLVGTGVVVKAYQGLSVSISADGNTAIVGGYGDNTSIGAAWVFTRSGSTWSQQGSKLIGTGAIGSAYQGQSVSISADGNTAMIGGLNDNNSIGAAWVFTPPSIITTSSLNTFNSCFGSVSDQQNFTISGTGLTANLVITAPIGFEISTTSVSGFGNTVSLAPAAGSVISTTIYIRLTSSASGSPSGNVVCSSTGVTTKNIAVSGLVNTFTTSTLNISICSNKLPYTWNGRNYNVAKTDTVFLTNAVGCDSLAILKLNIKLPSSSTKTISICPSALPYIWNSRTYNASKTDTVFLTNAVACDSIAILNLSVKLTSTSIKNISICPSELPYTWNGRTYNSAKTDTVFLTNAVGCDSLAILKLSIKLTSTSTKNISICPSALPYTWNGRTYNAAKTDTVILTNAVGCDSLAILKLSIKLTSTSTNKINICSSQLPYTWNGKTYNAAQTDTIHLINYVGCDSATIINLSVKPSPVTSSINGSNNAFRLDTISYSVIGTAGSTFNWSVTKGIIQSGAGANQIQVKWNVVGTDTLKVIETSSQGCVGLQNKLIVNVSPTSGINEINASNKIIIYPNPTTGMVNISSNQAIDNIEVFDVTGKLVLSHRNDNQQKHIELDLSAFSNGIYFIQTHNQNAEKTLNKVVISK